MVTNPTNSPDEEGAPDTQDIPLYLPNLQLDEPMAAIDIGGNSMEILILLPDKSIKTARYPLISGKSIGEFGKISPEAESVFKNALKMGINLLNQYNVKPSYLIAAATAGLRDATNGEEMVNCANAMGIPLKIIDGFEEACLVYPSVMKHYTGPPHGKNLVLEIGGGSTEIIPGQGSEIIEKAQIKILPLGTGRLPLNNPTDIEGIAGLRQAIQTKLHAEIPLSQREGFKNRQAFIKTASEWEAFRKCYQQQFAVNLYREPLTLKIIQEILTPPNLSWLEQITENQRFLDPKDAIKLVKKLVFLDEILSYFDITQIQFGPSWGLKVGLLEKLIQWLQNHPTET